MGRLFAAIYDRSMRQSEHACLGAWRNELLGDLTGRVLEIGAGTGRNLDFYPDRLERLVLCEPDRHMRRRLVARVAGRSGVEVIEAPVERLPLADASFDAVVSTLVLCSVPDLDAALAEIRRVLVPGGRFVFLEHVAADVGSGRHFWQRTLDPVWRVLAAGCHVTRRTGEAITAAGFEIRSERRESIRKAMPLVRPSVRGVAVRS